MRITVLTTRTNNTQVFYEHLYRLGHHLSVIIYDIIAPNEWDNLVRQVALNRPDVAVMIGATEEHHGHPVTPVQYLAQIGRLCPFIHLCCDGSDAAWWPQLQRYYDKGNFALQVQIDGVKIGPIAERGLTLLTPVDPTDYPDPPKSWMKRSITLGFPGNTGAGDRADTLAKLTSMGLLKHRLRDNDTGHGYREFLSNCKCVVNHALNGTGNSMHVKGRFLEAALAGALVLEPDGSPAADWFTANVDYLTYSSINDVKRLLVNIEAVPSHYERIAQRLRRRVINEHSPEIFWEIIFGRLGLIETTKVPRTLPFREWGQLPLPVQAPPVVMSVHEPPILLHTEQAVNLVSYAGKVHAIPQRIGCVELDRGVKHPSIKIFDSVQAALDALRRGQFNP